jgi:hypothetical protein
LDLIMGLMAVLLALSAFLLWVVFPRGYFAARTVWVLIHKWSGLAVGVSALLHVLLHWRWLVRMTRREFGRWVDRFGARRRQWAKGNSPGMDSDEELVSAAALVSDESDA